MKSIKFLFPLITVLAVIFSVALICVMIVLKDYGTNALAPVITTRLNVPYLVGNPEVTTYDESETYLVWADETEQTFDSFLSTNDPDFARETIVDTLNNRYPDKGIKIVKYCNYETIELDENNSMLRWNYTAVDKTNRNWFDCCLITSPPTMTDNGIKYDMVSVYDNYQAIYYNVDIEYTLHSLLANKYGSKFCVEYLSSNYEQSEPDNPVCYVASAQYFNSNQASINIFTKGDISDEEVDELLSYLNYGVKGILMPAYADINVYKDLTGTMDPAFNTCKADTTSKADCQLLFSTAV